jgi:hypothetical protein
LLFQLIALVLSSLKLALIVNYNSVSVKSPTHPPPPPLPKKKTPTIISASP